MKLLDWPIELNSRTSEIEIYPLGDIHLGARNCAEKHLRRAVSDIADNPNAYWFGGGDILDCIKPQDIKRFDFKNLPDWIVEGKAIEIKEKLADILNEQKNRAVEILSPIKKKCLGLIEGNHEDSIGRYYNQDIQATLCKELKVENLTDCFMVRLMFGRIKGVTNKVLFMFAQHGCCGGRTAGAEPNHLARLQSYWEAADIALRGHSHTYDIRPPKPVLCLPRSGELPRELLCKYRWVANWGCWLKSYAVGASSYDSRQAYPPRPLGTIKITIRPFLNTTHSENKQRTAIELPARIKIEPIILE